LQGVDIKAMLTNKSEYFMQSIQHFQSHSGCKCRRCLQMTMLAGR
jgi:hypothetical protein